MKKVSVIIPCYNCGTALHRTVKSVLQQTYPHLEIIIIDDGSNDNSYAVARQYEGDKVQVLQQANAGAAVARNKGLQHASGDFIQFLDAGDVLSESKIEEQVNALQESATKLAVCNYIQFTNEEELKHPQHTNQSSFIYSTNSVQEFLIKLWGGEGDMNFIQTNSWLLPKSLIEKAGRWRNYRCPDDDGEFFARVILASDGIVYTPGVYNYYHITPGGINQLSKSKNRKYLHNSLLTIDLKHQYLLQKGAHPLINKAIASQYLRFAVDMFPAQKILSAIAYKRYKSLNTAASVPLLGGSFIELIKNVFGWKAARFVRYQLREK